MADHAGTTGPRKRRARPRFGGIGSAERVCKAEGIWPVVGTDEAGRGPLAGPVVAAAVLLKPGARLPGLDDSKKLDEHAREALFPLVQRQSLAWAIAEASPSEIDELNILWASMAAMRRAVEDVLDQLGTSAATTPVDGPLFASARPQMVLVDGNRPIPGFDALPQRPLVQGDSRSRAIAAASILAKVHRDRWMVQADADHPGYGFAQHKGYPTPTHLAALAELGPSPLHRRSFRPVREALAR